MDLAEEDAIFRLSYFPQTNLKNTRIGSIKENIRER